MQKISKSMDESPSAANGSELPVRKLGLISSIVHYFPSKILPPLCSIAILPLLAKRITEAEMGQYFLLVTIVSISRALAFGWVGNCALRFYHAVAEKQRFYSNIIGAMAVSLVAMVAVIGASWFFLPMHYQRLMWIAIPLIALGGINSLASQLFRAQERPQMFTAATVGDALARTVCGYIGFMLLAGHMGLGNIESFAIGWLAGMVTVVPICIFFVGMPKHVSVRMMDWSTFRSFLVFGGPLMLVLLAHETLGTADKFLIAGLVGGAEGESQVGFYGMANRIAAAPMAFLASLVMLSVYPLAVRVWENKGNISDVANRGLRYFLAVAVPSVLFVGLFSRGILEAFAKESYADAALALRILLFATFLNGLAHYYRLPMLLEKRTKTLLIIGFGPALLNVLLNVPLILLFGYNGAAVATAISFASMCLLSWILTGKEARIPWPKLAFCRIIISVGLAAVVAEVASGYVSGWVSSLLERLGTSGNYHVIKLCVAGVLFSAAYVIVLIVTGELRSEIKALLARFRKLPAVSLAESK